MAYWAARIWRIQPISRPTNKIMTAFLAAYRAQDWDEARELLGRCRESDRQGLDKLHDVFAARVEAYSANPTDIDWDGVHVAQTK